MHRSNRVHSPPGSIHFLALQPVTFVSLAAAQHSIGTTPALLMAAVGMGICIFSAAGIFVPAWRGSWARGRPRPPASAVGCAAAALCTGAWSLCLLCEGIHFQPIVRITPAILAVATLLFFAGGIYDASRFKPPTDS